MMNKLMPADNTSSAVVPSARPANVTVESFTAVIKRALYTDDYQRDYVWSAHNVDQLLDDLADHFGSDDDSLKDYYLGTLLLHKEHDKYFVIDGQQRLTTLALLARMQGDGVGGTQLMRYGPRSGCPMRVANGRINKRQDDPRFPKIDFDRLLLTVVEVEQPDLAFTFFDTQNNRGVRLHGTSLLKAHHLRAINDPCQKQLQWHCARRWERMEQWPASLVLPHAGTDVGAFAQGLFENLLWPGRRWRGKRAEFASRDHLTEEFQVRTTPAPGDGNTAPLYRGTANRMMMSMRLSPDGQYAWQPNQHALSGSSADLPFALRQPLSKGIGFFLYTEKYAALLKWLLEAEHVPNEVEDFRELDQELVGANSVFLRRVFRLCALAWVDQFEHEQLHAFALWLEHALGSIRLALASVHRQRALKFFTEAESESLLDRILHAFTPEEVIDPLRDKARNFEKDLQIDGRPIASELLKWQLQDDSSMQRPADVDQGIGGVREHYARQCAKYIKKMLPEKCREENLDLGKRVKHFDAILSHRAKESS